MFSSMLGTRRPTRQLIHIPGALSLSPTPAESATRFTKRHERCHANPDLTLKREIQFSVECPRPGWSCCKLYFESTCRKRPLRGLCGSHVRGGRRLPRLFPHRIVKHRWNVTFDSSAGAPLLVTADTAHLPRLNVNISLHIFKANYWNIFHPSSNQPVCWGTASHLHRGVDGGFFWQFGTPLLLRHCHHSS